MYRLEILKQTPDIWLADETPREEQGIANGTCSPCVKGLPSELYVMNESKTSVSLGIEMGLHGLQLCETPEEVKNMPRRESSLESDGSTSSVEANNGVVHTVSQPASPKILVEKRQELQSSKSSESTQSNPVLDEYCEFYKARQHRLGG